MRRTALIDAVRATLAQAGFAVSEHCDLRPVSFDVVARRDRELLLIKVLTNVDTMSEAVANEIKVLCKFLEAHPLMVGLRAGTGDLESGVVYNRHDIPIVTPETLEAYLLQGAAPMASAAPGGFYVHLDSAALRMARGRLGISLGSLAQVAGVSRRAIQMYEEGMRASIEAAMRLEEYLELELIRPIDPLASFDAAGFDPGPSEAPVEATIVRMLEGLGYSVRSTHRSPFHAVSTQAGRHVLTGMGRDSPALRRRARTVESIRRVMERPGLFIVEHTTKTRIEGVPVVSRHELRGLTDPERILDLILERE